MVQGWLNHAVVMSNLQNRVHMGITKLLSSWSWMILGEAVGISFVFKSVQRRFPTRGTSKIEKDRTENMKDTSSVFKEE